MHYRIEIHRKGSIQSYAANVGDNLLDVLRAAGIHPDTPCGGKGTCGKCSIRVSGDFGAPSGSERALLGEAKLEKGYRLACRCTVHSDIKVFADDDDSAQAAIMTEGVRRSTELEPLVKKEYMELNPPSLEDQTPDMERVASAGRCACEGEVLPLLWELPAVLRSAGYKITIVSAGGHIIAVEPGDTVPGLYGAAFDIGTTTVAAYLYDLNSGSLRAVGSMLNPQRRYGADVISRIDYSGRSADNLKEMRILITDCINELLEQISNKAGIRQNDIYTAVFSGNTTMLHFLMGLDASGIAVSPFIPVTCGMARFSAKDGGLRINANGFGTALPCVSAYVGADTVAAILSCGMYELDGTALLVDIGTNGEIVLGGKDRLIACSTAAGPAFEGANIRFGMGGVTGAIDSFAGGPNFRYTVIGQARAKGVCGSGIIDAVSVLLDAGVIDETGRFADAEEDNDLPPEVSSRLTDIDGVRAFILAPGHESSTGEAICITQKDIREIQNAKAAIAAGIETLINHSGIGYENIKKVYLAGGFGSSIHTGSASRIGLLPAALADRVEAVGNASGSGASECLLSRKMLDVARSIATKVEYIELSASSYFTEKYVDNMFFQE